MSRTMSKDKEAKMLQTIQDSIGSAEQQSTDGEKKIFDLLAVIRDRVEPMKVEQFGDMQKSAQMLFLHLFDRVKDPRVQGRCKYSLGNILCLVLLCVGQLGKSSCTAVADRIYTCRKAFYDMGLLKKREPGEGEEDVPESSLIEVPSHDTIRRILSLVDPEELDQYLSSELSEYLRTISALCQQSRRHISIDGKVVRGSGRSDNTRTPLPNIQVLNFYDNSTAVCFRSSPIPTKTNEIPEAQDYLRRLNLKNTVVTFDALHTQRETVTIISHRKGIYVAPVKDNQQGLKNEIMARLEKFEKQISHAVMEDRDFDFYTLPKSYATDGFTGMKTFVRMVSHVRSDGDTIMYFISNTTDTQLIMEAICERWDIENGFHREKDWLVDEDGVTLTNKKAVMNIVVMNNYIVACARLYSALTGIEFRLAKDAVRVSPETVFASICSSMNDQELKESIQKQLEAGKRKKRASK
jgi:predicted transposase YbfD/YdcC